MKMLLLAVSFFVVIFSSIAQERENRPNIVFTNKSERLTKAVGWEQKDGKWYDHLNLISSSSNEDTSTCSNFYWLQSASFNFKGQKFYVFFYEKITGAYKYPALEQDWYTFHQTSFMVMSKVNYDSLRNIIDKGEGKSILVSTNIETGRVRGNYEEQGFLTELTSVMEKKNYVGSCFAVNSQKLKSGDVVRFLLPGVCSEFLFGKCYFELSLSNFEKLLID